MYLAFIDDGYEEQLKMEDNISLLSPIFFYNLQLSTYEKELEEMKPMTRQEYVANLRRY